MPVLLVMLNLAGVITGKQILAGWRWAVLITALFAAIATPAADVISMLLLMVPMVLLYFLAAGVASLFDRARMNRRKNVEAEIEAEIAAGASPLPDPKPTDIDAANSSKSQPGRFEA